MPTASSPLRIAGHPVLALLLLGALLLGASTLQAAPERRQIHVSGEAERRVAPDMATLRLQVLSEDRSPATARASVNEILRDVLRTLRAAGIEDEDIDSTGLSIEPQYRWLQETREQQLSAYRVTRSVVVRVLELEELGSLIEALSEAGVNRMQPPLLGLRDEEQVYREVLVEAVVNARERAAAMAAALGETLGEVIAISAANVQLPRPQFRAADQQVMMAEAARGAAETYKAGDLSYRVHITAQFTLLDKDRQ